MPYTPLPGEGRVCRICQQRFVPQSWNHLDCSNDCARRSIALAAQSGRKERKAKHRLLDSLRHHDTRSALEKL